MGEARTTTGHRNGRSCRTNTDTTNGQAKKKEVIGLEHTTVEAVAGGCTRACCKLCKQTFAYISGAKIAVQVILRGT